MRALCIAWCAALATGAACAAPAPRDFLEPPPQASELGRLPADGATATVNPVPFVWQPQRAAAAYELEWSRTPDFAARARRTNLTASVYCDAAPMASGTWHWRVRAVDGKGRASAWSAVRAVAVPADVPQISKPSDAELFARIPAAHPRLFLRPEDLPRRQADTKGRGAGNYRRLTKECARFLRDYKPPVEPPLYPTKDLRKTDTKQWQSIWWGNRQYVLKYLDGAARLAYKWRLDGDARAASVAREILLAVVTWDPKGSTGYRYNDEAGMPFCTRFSRAYTFLADYLSESDRAQCRALMRIRGEEMYRHLCPRLYQRPFDSHANRAWHFLGEAAVAFHGEIPEAEKWLSFAFNYFWCVYPVWGDADGGWHEGTSYWTSYMERFFRWADIMWSTFHVDVYAKPYFQHAGDFCLYQEVPGFTGGGFADCSEYTRVGRFASVMPTLALCARNPYWQWFADRATDGTRPACEEVYIEFARLDRVPPKARPPVDIPQSRLFRGTGLALMNTTLLDASNDVQVLFKSCPGHGTASHGYDANNSFIVKAWGDQLFIHGGVRDCYGTPFHSEYMWATRSCNAAGPTGDTQRRHAHDSRGEIVDFATTPELDRVTGVVGDMWEKRGATHHARTIHFRKRAPERILVVDRFEGPRPTTWSWYLHTPSEPFALDGGQHAIAARTPQVDCAVDFLYPDGLDVTTTDKFDPPIGVGRKLVQYHLEARTAAPSRTALFVVLLAPDRRAVNGIRRAPARLVRRNGHLFAEVPAGGETWVVDVGPEPTEEAK